MDQKYDFDGWSSRWDEDRIGFHVTKPNPYLIRYWQHLDEIKPKRCLVPLCGKSLDLVWLSEKVETVIGVELVEKAVLDFFREQQILPEIHVPSTILASLPPGFLHRRNLRVLSVLASAFVPLGQRRGNRLGYEGGRQSATSAEPWSGAGIPFPEEK